jgi:hypothetical protein
MAKELTVQEFDAVRALPSARRYEHFIKRVVDCGSIWGLKDANGWVTAADDENRTVFPVWPHEKYAASCAVGEWAGAAPSSISLSDWREKWVPGLRRDGNYTAVFPVASRAGVPRAPDHGVVVTSDRLLQDIDNHLSEWYGE